MKRKFDQYGFGGLMKLAICYFFTRIFYPTSRLIRLPIDIRGKKFIDFGQSLTTGIGCRLEAYPVDNKEIALQIGQNVQLNDYVHITAMKSVVIGNNVLMASKIYISDCTHGSYSGDEFDTSPDIPPMERNYSIKEVNIEDNVWIGESVSILPGVTIGKGSIIGANSVVSRNIPEYTIAVGAPAHPIKKYNFDTKKWEKYNFSK